MNREPIYAALLTLLQSLKTDPSYTALGVQTVSRAFKHWSDMSGSGLQPAVFLVPERETADSARDRPTKWTIEATLWVYVKDQPGSGGAGELQTTAHTIINGILDGIDTILLPKGPRYVQNLGGLVSHCSISGPIIINCGYIAGQAVAMVPLTLVTA